MYGIPITYGTQIFAGTHGVIIAIDVNLIYAESIQSMVLGNVSDETENASSVELSELYRYPNLDEAPNSAYCLSSGSLYIYVNITKFPISDDTVFMAIGTRTGIAITSLDQQIDVPERDLELFLKYMIRECAELKGKPVPASVDQDIKILESKYGV